jgi:hypothetical protein
MENIPASSLESTLKKISIRGRLAYGATCLENALKHYGIKTDLLEKEVLPLIWAFTSSTNLSEWDDAINEIDPVCVLDENDHNDPLLELYQNLPPEVVDMISDVIEIGTRNLYGGTESYSPSTLETLNRIILKCMSLQINLPELEAFKKSSFSEYHGWGFERDRSFFEAEYDKEND